MRLSCLFVFVMVVGCSAESGTPAGDVSDTTLDSGTVDDVPRDIPSPDPVLGHPHDGRLYAAAGMVVITPDDTNHPCTKFLGGTGTNRLAEGVHDDLETRVVLLAQDNLHVILVSMDLVGLEWPDTLRMRAKIKALGLNPDHLLVSSTHTHTGPDTIGVWGPKDGVTGRCPEYADFLASSLGDLVGSLKGTLQPVEMVVGETTIDEPSSSNPSLLSDSRKPEVLNNRVTAARFVNPEGETVATVVNWHNHPETMIEKKVYSSDFPRWTRAALEEKYGGTAVYFSGTVGGLMNPIDVSFPLYTEEGERILDDEGNPQVVQEGGERQAWSYGYALAEYVVDALLGKSPTTVNLSIEKTRIDVPVDNPVMILTFQSGVLEANPDLVSGAPEQCGPFGCLPTDLYHITLGNLHLVTLPGEVFPETSVGREETIVDWGELKGNDLPPWTYPAMEGYRSALPEGEYLMELGLTNQEIGYIVPKSDMLPGNHPDNYEEYFCLSPRTESRLREAIGSLLDKE